MKIKHQLSITTEQFEAYDKLYKEYVTKTLQKHIETISNINNTKLLETVPTYSSFNEFLTTKIYEDFNRILDENSELVILDILEK